MNRTQPLVLGIESSCDETGVGIVRGTALLTNTVSSSMDEHVRFGGVIPEIASRAHLDAFVPTLEEALAEADVTLADIDAIAVTSGPGLAGALMVGVCAAKALAVATGKPLYAINHLVAHVGVGLLQQGDGTAASPRAAAGDALPENMGALLVSGGHTEILRIRSITDDVELLGSTIDDAAGEAYDKVARLLGLGYPGGPAIDKLARTGNAKAIRFPRGLTQPKYMGTAEEPGPHRYDWSFSGLKTAVARCVEQFEARGEDGSRGGHRRGLPGSRGGCDHVQGRARLPRKRHHGGPPRRGRCRQLAAAPAHRTALQRRRDPADGAAAVAVHGQRRHGGRARGAAGDGRSGTERDRFCPGLLDAGHHRLRLRLRPPDAPDRLSAAGSSARGRQLGAGARLPGPGASA